MLLQLSYFKSWVLFIAQVRIMAQCFTSIDFHKNNIPFYEYDIEKSSVGHDQYRAVGGRGVPVLLVNQSVIRGYSPDEILKYLE